MDVSKLTRAQVEHILLTCHREQRAPTSSELCVPTPKKLAVSYTAERTAVGRFHLLDDDTLTEVMTRLPIKARIIFVKSLCKQFAGVAYERKVFNKL